MLNLKNCVETELDTRQKYSYSYGQYLCASIMQYCCCCCKKVLCVKNRTNRRKLHLYGTERLENELDLLNVIKTLRVSEFMARLTL